MVIAFIYVQADIGATTQVSPESNGEILLLELYEYLKSVTC